MTLKVLIVDDEAHARSRLRTLLAECTEPRVDVVGEAANAVQAVEQIQRTNCDLLLLDVRMPGVDGVQLASRLREMGMPPAIVFVTAYAEHAVEAFELEAVDYLTKPVRRERLQQALSEVIYLKAELKYITVRTAEKEHIFDGALNDLEQRYPHLFVRVHRNALVARRAVRAVEKHNDPIEGEGWMVRLDGVDERLAVSRRQLAAVREALMS